MKRTLSRIAYDHAGEAGRARSRVPWTAALTALGAIGAVAADESGLVPITAEQWDAMYVVGTVPLLGLMIYSLVRKLRSQHLYTQLEAERRESPNGH